MQDLAGRTCTSDPPPPQRFCNSFYLVASYAAEFIGRGPPLRSPANFVSVYVDTDPDIINEQSSLDTLYMAEGKTMPGLLPVMTYYHGGQTPQMVFSGFPLWYFQRKQ